jgi:DNA polymerase-3 subunit alpha
VGGRSESMGGPAILDCGDLQGHRRLHVRERIGTRVKYVSLHTHTTFSYGDGFGPVRAHVSRVADLGMKAVGLTEHGNTSSHVQLEKACEEYGIKPLYGCELYTAPTDPEGVGGSPIKTRKKFHQTVIAQNEEGYRNLNRMVSASWEQYHFQWPTVSATLLEEYSEGLVVLSGCADSLLSCTLLGGKELGPKRLEYTGSDFRDAREVIERYQDIFGERYFLEVQRFPGLDRTCILNPAFAELSRVTGARLVATSDVHYPFPEDNEMQRVLHAAHRGGTVEQMDASWEYDILLTYPTSDKEIFDDLVATGLSRSDARAAIAATADIAAECTVKLPRNESIKFPYPGSDLEGMERTWAWETEPEDDEGFVREYTCIEEYIWQKLRDGWRFRAEGNPHMVESDARTAEYVGQLRYEMGQISAKEFLHYFAMLSDAVSWAKDHKIPVGPARGSAAASLTCYLLRIIEVDPMQFPHMLFARFIDPNRLDLPDVDLDFADDRRDEVRKYLISVYGANRVGNIGNFIRYKGKNSIDDIARVYRIPSYEAKIIKDRIVERSGGDARQSESLADTFAMFEQAREVLDRHPEFRLAERLEGNYRSLGKHAAGIVISNAPITDTCAIYVKDGVTVVAYDKKDTEYLGMLKADFLGLSTMGMIGIALDIIGMDLEDLYRVPITEERTLRAFKDNDLTGIFQFEGRATAIVNANVGPNNFGHLADINALSRPGPLFSGMTAQYCDVKHGREKPERLHPVVDELTGWTYGQIVYQEQVLSIVKDLAGFPMARVGDIRRIISQKLGRMVMANAYQEFEEGCFKTHGIKATLAQKIWNFIATSSTYSFNQSHSVSYSLLAFWCMYLKQYHPTAFYAAQLTKVGDGKDDLYDRGKLMQDALRHDVSISPPNIELSKIAWYADVSAKEVIAGFIQVPGIGPKTAENILAWRKDELGFRELSMSEMSKLDWSNLIEVKGIGPKTIEKIEAFTTAEDPFGIHAVENKIGPVRRAIENGEDGFEMLPAPTHHSSEMPREGAHTVCWLGVPMSLNYKDYIEATRTRTNKSVEEIIAEMKDPDKVKSCVVRCYDEGDEDVYLRFNRWRFPQFERALEALETEKDLVLVKGSKREDFGISIHVTDMWIISGDD